MCLHSCLFPSPFPCPAIEEAEGSRRRVQIVAYKCSWTSFLISPPHRSCRRLNTPKRFIICRGIYCSIKDPFFKLLILLPQILLKQWCMLPTHLCAHWFPKHADDCFTCLPITNPLNHFRPYLKTIPRSHDITH